MLRTERRAATAPSNTREARWIDWIDATHVAIATAAGSVLILSVDPRTWAARLKALAPETAASGTQ